MPKVDVYNMQGKKVSDVELSEAVFGIEPNENIVHSALVNYLANQRQGTQSTKTRAEVRGGGRKPWRQKGTGRARQGSIRAPQWVKGGIALGPKPRSYKYTVNKKERRLAIKSLLSSKVLEKELSGSEIKRPKNWGGFLVRPVEVEFWQGRANRLHDRIRYKLNEDYSWKIERLSP